jgi:uncharacterized protein YbaR (Trm112 family)
MNHTPTTKLEGLTIQRKATGETFTITGKDGAFFLLNGGADNGGRDVLGSELCYYTRLDLSTPQAHYFDIPDHVYEDDPLLEWVCCPLCQGEKWLEVEGNHWTRVLFSDIRRAFAYRALNHSYKPCTRCGASGEVLDLATFDELSPFDELTCSLNTVQTESAKTYSMNTEVTQVAQWQLAA